MPWILPCPSCDHPIRPRPASDGQWARCPSCRVRLQLPSRPLHIPPPLAADPVDVPAALPPTLPSNPPTAGFWRGLVIGVGAVALTAVIALGVRGLWPAPQPLPAGPRGMGGGMHSGSAGPMPPGPNGMIRREEPPPEDALIVPVDVDHKVVLRDEGPKLTTAGTLVPFVALASAPQAGLLLAATDNGELHLHAAADLAPRGRVLLEGPAYHVALDEAAGRLYAASGETGRLRVNRLGERETPPADIVVYDVKDLLAGRAASGTRLAASARMELNAPVGGMILASDGRSLYYMVDSSREAHVGRVNAATLARDQMTKLGYGGTTGLALSPDGTRLYVLASARVLAFDPQDWREVGSVLVGTSPSNPVAINGGRVMLLDRRPNLQVLVVDVPAHKAIARWDISVDGRSMDGRPWLAPSSDGKQAFLGCSAVLDGHVWQLDCDGPRLACPVVLRSAASDRTRLLRGPLHVSPDGRFVYLGNGVVLTPEA